MTTLLRDAIAFNNPIESAVNTGLSSVANAFGQLATQLFKLALAAVAAPSSTDEMSKCGVARRTADGIVEPAREVSSNIGACAPNFIFAQTYWLVMIVATLSIIIAGSRMMLSRDTKPAKDLAIGLGITAITVAGGLGLVVMSMQVTDAFSDAILGNLDGGTLGKEVTVEQMFPEGEGQGAVPTAMMIVFGPMIALAAAVQMMLMYARLGMIVMFAGLLPLAASATMTSAGRGWFIKITAWLAAAILYKPVAILIYAVAYQMMVGHSAGAIFGGIALMVLAIFALPALMRLFVPATASVAGKGGGGVAMGGAVATGAIMLASGGTAAAAAPAIAAGAGAAGNMKPEGA